MSEATRHRGAHSRGSHHGGGGNHDDGGGGGGGGGGGRLVKVGFARNEAEAEMLQGLLLQSGIPSVLKRAGGFDNPDFLVAGPRDIWVNKENADAAREVLSDAMTESEGEERAEIEDQARLEVSGGAPMSAARLAMWVGGSFVIAVIIIWVVYEITR